MHLRESRISKLPLGGRPFGPCNSYLTQCNFYFQKLWKHWYYFCVLISSKMKMAHLCWTTYINHWPFWSSVKYCIFCCLHLTTYSALCSDFNHKNLAKLELNTVKGGNYMTLSNFTCILYCATTSTRQPPESFQPVTAQFLGCTVTQFKNNSETIQWINSRSYHAKGDK